ncbi:regucalcin-like [Asbolus verrucosus]|uniref:Regucalcin n=1 Tax=Asbolus verrucosus TaxID=1661398 RepID=A0A482VMU7_ASBVE|nr:regucalcin-like [Asbolus verrucosus]
MTIDEDDNLWVALYGGGAIVKVNSTRWMEIFYKLYSLNEEQRKQQPTAGAVFAVVGLETRGLPVFEVDLLESLDDEITEPLIHGECPTWDSRNNILYYVDIHVGKIYSYNYTSKEITSITLNGEVAPVVPSKSNPNMLIVGLDRSIVAVKWNKDGTFTSKLLVVVADDKPDSRMNDGKADKEGRIWFGTMGKDGDVGTPNEGTLYKVTRDNVSSPEVMVSPVNISNGMAWNKANNKFYYIDSPTLQVSEYDYDNEKGTISNRRVAFDLKNYNINAHPDGMTIDQDDNLWIALYGGGSVIKVNPTTGELLNRIPIPAECVTSVMWGGPDLDVLFVTTSRVSLTEEEINEQPGAGSVYALINLGTKGVPVFEADIIDSI